MYSFLADSILVLHAGIIVFVVLSPLMILAGGLLDWGWIRNFRFRVLHLLTVMIVVAQVWLGVLCPLTTLEMWLRKRAGAVYYNESFIQHWLQMLLFYDLPNRVFIVAYTIFGLVVVASWVIYPPENTNPNK
jgi:polyferredoxin